jgi:hypothetical protein
MVWSRFTETLAEKERCQEVTEHIQSMSLEPSSAEAVSPVGFSLWEDMIRLCSNGRKIE